MSGKPIVAIVRCNDYNQEAVASAVADCIALTGGLQDIVLPGETVLLKPNLLSSRPWETAVTTHPAVIEAVARAVAAAGGIPLGGDSPGGGLTNPNRARAVYSGSGMNAALARAGGQPVNFDGDRAVAVEVGRPGARVRVLHLARAAVEAQAIINLPKLKTHTLTLLSAAVKNMFGTVPGVGKGEYHRLCPVVDDFADCLLDIYFAVRPRLNILDAVLAMEGDGPSAGAPVWTRCLVASRDGIALDTVAAAMAGVDPGRVPVLRRAAARGLGPVSLEGIELIGVPLASVCRPLKLPNSAIARIPPWLMRLGWGLIKSDPVPGPGCNGCAACVANCPVSAVTMQRGRPELQLRRCIGCLCCHELCPQRAMRLQYRYPLMGLVLSAFGRKQRSRGEDLR
ncbi:MAG: DUF362 domain-containing protein [Bacillota bacterium]